MLETVKSQAQGLPDAELLRVWVGNVRAELVDEWAGEDMMNATWHCLWSHL